MCCSQIHRALSSISSLTDILSADSYVTVSTILPILNVINTKFLKGTEDDNTLTVDMKESIKTNLNSRYTTEHIGEAMKVFLQTATFLDPRFKSKYIDSEEKLKQECSTITFKNQVTNQLNPDDLPPPKKKRTLETLFKDNEYEDVQNALISVNKRVECEIHSYVISSKSDFKDLLMWWKNHQSEYPYLSKFAAKYLCICATSCSSECLSSTSGNIATPTRSSMKPDTIDMLTFLSRNL